MEVNVNNMLVKSKMAKDHILHLKKSFEILQRYKMKFNPNKCAFRVAYVSFSAS